MVTPLNEHDSAETAILAHGPRGLGRVLVVDDDDVIRRLIAANLTLEGFDVAMAVDGQECVDNVSAIAPDIVILDVRTSRMDGWETARRLRESPDTSHIKVVLITARVQEDDPPRNTHVGADAYVTKPFDPGALIRAIRELAGAG
jgi:CheY-like chemotaxis protein